MKKPLAAAAALLTISASAFAALPPGVFTSQRPAGPPPHHSHVTSSQRVHVGPSQFTHTPTGNRVRMTNPHGHTGPVGGRMSSGSFRHAGPSSATVHVGPPAGPARRHIGPVSGPRYDRNYVRPSLPPPYYRPIPPLPPPRWRYAGYYSGHYWRPYYRSVWFGYPIAYYGYPGIYPGVCYVRPGVRISVRI